MRKAASIGSIVVGVMMIIGGLVTWTIVSTTLADQNIVIPDDAIAFAGNTVNGPLDAYVQADIINKHTLDSTGGLTYAELDREDPLRDTAMNSAFLQSSLFTSVVAFGVAGMAMGMGLLFILIGLGIRDVQNQVVLVGATSDEKVSVGV